MCESCQRSLATQRVVLTGREFNVCAPCASSKEIPMSSYDRWYDQQEQEAKRLKAEGKRMLAELNTLLAQNAEEQKRDGRRLLVFSLVCLLIVIMLVLL